MTDQEMADLIRDYAAVRERPLLERLDRLEAALPALVARLAKAEARGLEHHGAHVPGRDYSRGDCVMLRGSSWVCVVDSTRETPGDGAGSWRLLARSGRDAR
ncbi:MAG TPA: hypothetical protein VFY29_07200 [Terriglobia bacterium]|nr:hypothetical protein [Terriglobia bacterium]